MVLVADQQAISDWMRVSRPRLPRLIFDNLVVVIGILKEC